MQESSLPSVHFNHNIMKVYRVLLQLGIKTSCKTLFKIREKTKELVKQKLVTVHDRTQTLGLFILYLTQPHLNHYLVLSLVWWPSSHVHCSAEHF